MAEMCFQNTIISLLEMYRIHLPLLELYSAVLISLNVMWNIRNKVDKKFVRTKCFSPVSSTNVKISYQNFLSFSFNPFITLV